MAGKTPTTDNALPAYAWYLICLIIVVSFSLFLFQLGSHAFIDYDELTYAQVIDNTLQSGTVLTLSRHRSPWFDKPPLYYWSAMAAGNLFENKEIAYRLPSALTGILSVVLVMLIAFELTESYVAAIIAGAILCTSPLFLEAGRQLRLDVPVTAAILFAVYSFIRGLKDPRWYMGVGVGIALGILTKSVIGLFPLGFIFFWAVVHRSSGFLKSAYFWIGMALMLAIAAPWHIYLSILYGRAFWNTYLFTTVINRAAKNVLGQGSAGSNENYFMAMHLTQVLSTG